MRLVYDLAVLRHPAAGTVRYATELLRAMREARGGDEVVPTGGWPRVSRGGRVRRLINLTSDLGWLTVGADIAAARARSDVWFSPANTLPLALPRPKIVAILDTNVIRAAGDYDRAYVAYARRMLKLSADRADAILTLSEDARQSIGEGLAIPLDRIVVAYPGIDHAAAIVSGPPPPGLPAPYALFVGQSEPHKNIGRLIEAWGGDVPPNLGLVLAGPAGRDEERIRELIAASPARDRIHRLGAVSDGELERLYLAAACFVFPSLAEGFGLPPLEAMARGIPTAVANAGPLPEVTDDGAILFDPLRPESIAAAVTSLVLDTDLRSRLAVDGPAVASRYRWDRTADIAWRTVRSLTSG